MLRVLLVAPQTDLLLVSEEVEDVIRSGLTVTPMLGKVSRTELLREIKRGSYDVLWMATHGNKDGIQLSDGILSASELVPQVRDRFRLVVLNTCSSLQVAQQIQEEANCSVICTIVDIPDDQAFHTGSLLASALAQLENISNAYQRAKPGGNRSYLYLAALVPTADLIAPLVSEMKELRVDLQTKLDTNYKRLWWVSLISLGLHPITWVVVFSLTRNT